MHLSQYHIFDIVIFLSSYLVTELVGAKTIHGENYFRILFLSFSCINIYLVIKPSFYSPLEHTSQRQSNFFIKL